MPKIDTKILKKIYKRHFRDSIVHVFLIVVAIILVSSNAFLYSELKTVTIQTDDGEVIEKRLALIACDKACRDRIKEDVLMSLPEQTATPAPTIVRQSVAPTQKSTSFIPLGVAAATTSMDWIDVETSGFSLDLAQDYGNDAVVSFEAFLKVAHSNGKAYARLFDKTHGMAVAGSEVSVENTDTSTLVTTMNLPIWAGRNNYKVQIKSLNSFEVTYDGGRLKIVH